MTIHTLNTLQYSKDSAGPWGLYVYRHNGYHTGAVWFARKVRNPDEQITIAKAKAVADAAIAEGKEVRITDSGDMLVFHSQGCKQLYPDGDFWGGLL
jgi:hypothetical protein